MAEQIQEKPEIKPQDLPSFEITRPKLTEESQSEVQEQILPVEQLVDPYEQFKNQRLQSIMKLDSPENQLLTCCLDPQGDHLCVGTDKGEVNIYSTRKPKPLYTIKSGEPCNCLRYVQTSISGHLLLSCSPGCQIIELWHTTSERLLKQYKTEGSICLDSCLDQADYFCTGGYDGLIREYSLEKNIITEYKQAEWLSGHTNRIMCVKTLGSIVLSCAWDEVLYLWDRRTARSVDCTTGVRAFGTDALNVLNNNKTIVTANYRDYSQLQFLDITDLKRNRQTIPWEQYDKNSDAQKGQLYAVKVFANDDLVVGSASDNQIRVFSKQDNYKCVALDKDTNGQAIYSVDLKGNLISAVGQNGFGKILKY